MAEIKGLVIGHDSQGYDVEGWWGRAGDELGREVKKQVGKGKKESPTKSYWQEEQPARRCKVFREQEGGLGLVHSAGGEVGGRGGWDEVSAKTLGRQQP